MFAARYKYQSTSTTTTPWSKADISRTVYPALYCSRTIMPTAHNNWDIYTVSIDIHTPMSTNPGTCLRGGIQGCMVICQGVDFHMAYVMDVENPTL